MQSSAAESVRVICRFRPQRDQLLRGGGQGGSQVPLGKGGLGHKTREAAAASTLPTGFKIEYATDTKSLTFHTPGAPGVKAKPNLFTYDRIFGPESTQSEAFDAIARDTVADVLKGYNGSIFAYGQTGSGKTFTMFGPSGNHAMRGVIPRAADALFAGISDSEELEEVTIKCSFLEIYKENIRDLLQPKNTGLRIRELPTGEVYVQGLSDEYVSSPEDIMQLLQTGEKSRSTAATEMNEVSSRSHSVLIVIVNQKLKDGSVRVGKLNLADLAGSERIERTQATGETLEEAKKINQSLSALGNCINALTDSKRTHTPFRDSTLTFLLKDSLGGNTKTTLLVCASPEENDCLETLSTLNFAKRAKKIKNSVSVNMKLGVAELTLMVAELKKELALAHKTIVALQKTIKTMNAGGTIPKEMMDQLLKPVTASTSVNTIDQLTSSDLPAVPASMLAAISGDGKQQAHAKPSDQAEQSPQAEQNPQATAEPATPAEHTGHAGSRPMTPTLGTAGLLDDDSLLPFSIPTSPSSVLAGASASAQPFSDRASESTHTSPLQQPDFQRAVSQKTALLEAAEGQLSSANAEIHSLRSQLEAEQEASEQRELEWAAERERLMAEVEALASSGAPAQRLQSPSSPSAAATAKRASLSPRAAPAAPAADSSNGTAAGSSGAAPRTPPAPSRSLPIPAGSPPRARSVSVMAPSAGNPMGSPRTDPLLTILRAKNARLEKQMADMKDTWTAYLDLIVENQKHQQAEKEREEALKAGAAEAVATTRGAKIVKPLKPAKTGFFASLFRKSSTPTVGSDSRSESRPQSAAPRTRASGNYERSGVYDGAFDGVYYGRPASAASSTLNSPVIVPHRRGASVADYAFDTLGASHSSSVVSSPTPMGQPRALHQPIHHSHSSSMGGTPSATPSASPPPLPPKLAEKPNPAQTHSFEGAIRIGYLSRRPAGIISGLARGWTSFLFVLRSHSLDYYEIRGQPQSSDSLSSVTTPGSSPARDPILASTPPNRQPSGGPPASPGTSNLLSHPRGSIPLDPLTTLTAVSSTDAPFAFEISSRSHHSKLSARTDQERHEWMSDILSLVGCMKRGVDPSVMVPVSGSSVSAQASPDTPGTERKFSLDPQLVSNANQLLQHALDRLPEPSPGAEDSQAQAVATGGSTERVMRELDAAAPQTSKAPSTTNSTPPPWPGSPSGAAATTATTSSTPSPPPTASS